MKISTKGRYGLRALVDLAVNVSGQPVPLTAIAARQRVSVNYLEQVFGQLRRGGILQSTKGAGGGYSLSRDPSCITVREILEVLEGPFCITNADRGGREDKISRAVRTLLWEEIDRRTACLLEEKTLADLIKKEADPDKEGKEARAETDA
nr:Rrf2 family transcriptional regulator [uncultured Lachnoclostridium sp.]